MDEDIPTPGSQVELLYDAECPLCDAYCKAVRLRETVGPRFALPAHTA